jgi:hypothetical protein
MADSPENDTKEVLKTLGLGPAAQELYIDLLKPTAIELGKNIHVVARLISIALSPLRGAVWGLEKVIDWLPVALLKRLASIDPEKIQSPEPYIAGQVLLQLPSCAEQEQLRELYANLLAAAMNKDLASDVHPAFVQVIQQLTPDEALVLKELAKRQAEAARGGRQILLMQTISDTDMSDEDPSLLDQFIDLCECAGVTRSDQIEAYFDNLVRLRIVTEEPWSQAINQTYDGEDGKEFIENRNHWIVTLSAFGKRFLSACIQS